MSQNTPPVVISAVPECSSNGTTTITNQTKSTVTLPTVKNGLSESSEATTRRNDVATPPIVSVSNREAVDAWLAQRRRSLVPMSSMEEENLRERLHLAQIKLLSNYVSQESRYIRDTFKRLFQSKVDFLYIRCWMREEMCMLNEECVFNLNL